jgi:hypothetical protein
LTAIQRIPQELWTPEMAERVRAAATENDQITDAHVGFGDDRSTVAAEANVLLRSLGFETPSSVA